MNRATRFAVSGILSAIVIGGAAAAETGTPLSERETLTNNWFGLGDALDERGIGLSLGLTQMYQRNVHGGIATGSRSGELPGSYDLELDVDLGKLTGIRGGRVYGLAEGSWSDGIDGKSVGSLFGVNDDAGGDRTVDVTVLYYEQALFDERVRVRVGKIDLTGGFECRGCPVSFDGNMFANDETAQFLNGALVNNPTIPFPDNGLGVILYVEPVPGAYFSAGIADAQADARETGFRTAFHGEDYFFSIFEVGFVPVLSTGMGDLPGAYRFGVWYDPQPKERLDDASRSKRDDVGFYLSYDQMVWRESADPDDAQGAGVFWRFGAADKTVNPIKTFWSAGAQYQGPLPGRDDDVLGFGVAQGRTSRRGGFTESNETAYEVYYNARVAPWLRVTPSFQYIEDPGSLKAVGNAIALGVRAQVAL